MAKIYNSKPYYEYYNKAKGYVKMLAIPERGAQSVEWNMLQSMLLQFIKDIGDSIYHDGNIVEGCSMRIDKTVITIDPGRVYMDGIIHDIDGATLTITGKGEEYIGVVIDETVVTELEDNQFFDPAVGSSNYLHPGCYRVKQVARFVVNDPTSAVVATFIDGQVKSVIEEKPVMDTMSDVLARRTFDESGNYVVSGFELSESNYATKDSILINLNKGKAYVRGYEVQKAVGTTFYVRKATDIKEVLNEPHVVSAASNIYEVINTPVQKIKRVSTTMSALETVTRGSLSGTVDALKHTQIVEIQQVSQGSKTYTPGLDYVLKNDKIDWSSQGAEPDPGSTYSVKYTYKSVLNEGADYQVVQSDNTASVVIKNNNLVAGTEMLIDYDFYLARKDTICIDQTGGILVTEGQPNYPLLCEAPIVNDTAVLQLGTVLVYPNSTKVFVSNSTIRVSTMERIQKTINRVSDLEYNMSVTDLDNEAMAGEAITELKGVFTDGFLNFNKSDITRSDVAYSLDDYGTLNLPFKEWITGLSVSTDASNAYATSGTNWTCPYTETLLLSQPYGTQSMKVNPYQVFNPMMTVTVDPAVDNWVDTSTTTVEEVNLTTATIEKWWLPSNHMSQDKTSEYKNVMSMMGFDPSIVQVKRGNASANGIFDTSTSLGKKNNWKITASNEHVTGAQSKVLSDTAALYMRCIDLKVTSETFEPKEEVQVKFAGVTMKLTPLGSTSKGTTDTRVRADANGKIEASFKIPSKTPCSTVEIKMESTTHKDRVAITSFTSEGRNQKVEETIYIQRNVLYAVDPIAQSFMFDKDYNITGVDLYFTANDGRVPVNVQVRGMTNGYPNTMVYAEQIVTGSNIKVSANGSVPTRVTFPNLVKCEANTQYCIVVLTDSAKISLSVANLGEKDLITGKYVISNPYSTGVLFSSSNASTWTAHQDKDLKFNLYRANYSPKGTIVFNNVSLNSVDKLMLAIDSVVPANCTCKFEVSVNNGLWYPYLPWVDYPLNLNANYASIRCQMTSSGNQSPIISSITPKMYSSKNDLKATYISKNLNIPEGFNSIKIYLDTAIVDGATYEIYYTLDVNGTTWTKATPTSTTPLSEYYNQIYCEIPLDSPSKNYRVKIVMTTTKSYLRAYCKRLMNILRDV